MRKFLLAGVAAAGLAFSPTVADAAMIGSIPGAETNHVLPPVPTNPGIEGWFGAQLYLIGGPSQITATLIGSEAGATNTFEWDGATIFSISGTSPGGVGTLGAPVGTQSVFNGVLSGLLPFGFTSTIAGGTFDNGNNVVPGMGQGNIFITLADCPQVACLDTNVNGSTPAGGQVAWLWFDDLGANVDDNHDDLVVRLEITGGRFTVPEPASLGLLGAGLLGLAFAARRRRNA